MNIPKSFTNVTKTSKILALILFVSLPFIGAYFGMKYKQCLPIYQTKNTKTSEVPNPQKTSEKKSDATEMEWQNLKLTIPKGSFNVPVRLSLSFMGHLNSNEFQPLTQHQLAVYQDEGKSVELIKPIKMIYDLNYPSTVSLIDRCGFDINTVSFYVNEEKSPSHELNKYKKLETSIDLENNTIQAELDSLMQTGETLAYPRNLGLTDMFFAYEFRINLNLLEDLYNAPIALATGNLGGKTQFNTFPWRFCCIIGLNL